MLEPIWWDEVDGTVWESAMFQAQYIFAGDSVFGPWIPRQGDNMIATVDMVAINGSGENLAIDLYEKNLEDTGSGALVSGALTSSAVGRSSSEWTGVKELVRFKFAPKNVTDGYVLIRMLDIVWFDTVKA